MTALGQDEWAAAGREPLTAPISSAEYMALLLERQSVYDAVHPPVVAWISPLLEWFCWPEDSDFVILPDRVTAEPRPTRPAPTVADLTAKRDALASQLGRLIIKRDQAVVGRAHNTDDMAAYGGIGIRQTARQRAKRAVAVDRSIAEVARLAKRIDRVRFALARVDAQIAKAS